MTTTDQLYLASQMVKSAIGVGPFGTRITTNALIALSRFQNKIAPHVSAATLNEASQEAMRTLSNPNIMGLTMPLRSAVYINRPGISAMGY
jgi:hypothetical protein